MQLFNHQIVHRQAFVGGLITMLVTSAPACHKPREPEPAPAPCIGARVAVRVHNLSGQRIDVYLRVENTNTGTPLGFVDPGVHTLMLPLTDKTRSVWFESRRPSGTTVAPTFSSRNRDEFRRIRYELLCEG